MENTYRWPCVVCGEIVEGKDVLLLTIPTCSTEHTFKSIQIEKENWIKQSTTEEK